MVTAVDALAAQYSRLVSLHHVYILEAHPVDGWADEDNTADGVCIKQPRTLQARLAAANAFAKASGGLNNILVDGMDNEVELAYEARPEKLVAIGPGGKVIFKTGIGPYQYSLPQLEKFCRSLEENAASIAGSDDGLGASVEDALGWYGACCVYAGTVATVMAALTLLPPPVSILKWGRGRS